MTCLRRECLYRRADSIQRRSSACYEYPADSIQRWLSARCEYPADSIPQWSSACYENPPALAALADAATPETSAVVGRPAMMKYSNGDVAAVACTGLAIG
jgi:hypothetical protein